MKNKHRFIWFFGFAGFYGFRYFATYNPFELFWFSYFSFFAYYFTSKLANEMPDERFYENSKRAKLKTAIIPVATVFLVGLGAGLPFVTREIIVLACALGFSVTILSYAVLFWYYDTH